MLITWLSMNMCTIVDINVLLVTFIFMKFFFFTKFIHIIFSVLVRSPADLQRLELLHPAVTLLLWQWQWSTWVSHILINSHFLMLLFEKEVPIGRHDLVDISREVLVLIGINRYYPRLERAYKAGSLRQLQNVARKMQQLFKVGLYLPLYCMCYTCTTT